MAQHIESRGARAASAGFTLIELLVAIAILGILGTVAVKELWGYFDESKQLAAKEKVDAIAREVRNYYRKHNDMPRDLDTLAEPDNNNNGNPYLSEDYLVDPWGNEFVLKKGDRTGDYEVVCLGANGTEDGYDLELGLDRDISSKFPLNPAERK